MFFSKPQKIGLALGSGGPKGLAHIGVLRALNELKVPIDCIAGCSAGSLIGGIYAINGDLKIIEDTLNGIDKKTFLSVFADINIHSGMIRGQKAFGLVNHIVENIKIEDLKTPFQAVATRVDNGEPIIMKRGMLSSAIRASCSVPYLFESVIVQGHHAVDGAVCMPVPVPLVKTMGATKIIAVNLDQPIAVYYDQNNKPQVNLRSLSIGSAYFLQCNLAKEQMKGANVIIQPDIPAFIRWSKFIDGADIIEEGYKSVMEKKQEILALL